MKKNRNVEISAWIEKMCCFFCQFCLYLVLYVHPPPIWALEKECCVRKKTYCLLILPMFLIVLLLSTDVAVAPVNCCCYWFCCCLVSLLSIAIRWQRGPCFCGITSTWSARAASAGRTPTQYSPSSTVSQTTKDRKISGTKITKYLCFNISIHENIDMLRIQYEVVPL